MTLFTLEDHLAYAKKTLRKPLFTTVSKWRRQLKWPHDYIAGARLVSEALPTVQTRSDLKEFCSGKETLVLFGVKEKPGKEKRGQEVMVNNS